MKLLITLCTLFILCTNSSSQIKLSQSIDSINNVGKELSGYDFIPEKEYKKFISISCNKEQLTVRKTLVYDDMSEETTYSILAFKDISMRFPLTLQAHNYKDRFKEYMLSNSDTLLNTTTDFVYIDLMSDYQPKEIAAKQARFGQILSRNILYLAYSKPLGKSTNGQIDSIYSVLRDDEKIRLDFAKLIGGVPLSKLDELPKLNQSTEIGAIINLMFKEKFNSHFIYPDKNLPLEIYFTIIPSGEAVNIYSNQKVFWFYDFRSGQNNRYEIMTQGESDNLFLSIKNKIGFTDLETLDAITNMISSQKFTPGILDGKKVATVHKITLRP